MLQSQNDYFASFIGRETKGQCLRDLLTVSTCTACLLQRKGNCIPNASCAEPLRGPETPRAETDHSRASSQKSSKMLPPWLAPESHCGTSTPSSKTRETHTLQVYQVRKLTKLDLKWEEGLQRTEEFEHGAKSSGEWLGCPSLGE